MKGICCTRRVRAALAALFSIVLVLSALAAAASRAEAYDVDTAFTTEKYDVHIKVGRDDSYDVTEKIDVNFLTARHGIYRYIPVSSEYVISGISVPSEPSSVSTFGGNRVIRIGSGTRTVTGRKSYTIRYKIKYLREHDSSCDIMNIGSRPYNGVN